MSSLLDKYTKGNGRGPLEVEDEPESDEPDDLGYYGWLRGSRERAVCLELRRKDGCIRAIPYGWIERFEFDPSTGITLVVPGGNVKIEGRNLNGETRPQVSLFNGLARNRIPWIREASAAEVMETAKETVLVETIRW